MNHDASLFNGVWRNAHECESIHLLLIADAQRGFADIAAGRSQNACAAIAQWQQNRSIENEE